MKYRQCAAGTGPAQYRMSTRDISFAALFVPLITVCSWISVPAAVPFTLQTFAVFLAAALLGGKLGTISVAAYLTMGAVGIPVFAGMQGGIQVLIGPTGGYIAGFLFSTLFIWGIERCFGTGNRVFFISMIPALIICYAFGTAWFVAVYTKTTGEISVASALSMCVFPFIVPDAVKIVLVFLLRKRLRPFVV